MESLNVDRTSYNVMDSGPPRSQSSSYYPCCRGRLPLGPRVVPKDVDLFK